MNLTPQELIAELDCTAQSCWDVALVVGFEHTTLFVFANDRDKLAKLVTLIEQGGLPCGMIRAVKNGNKLEVGTRALVEGVDDYLDRLVSRFRDDLLACGLTDKLDNRD